MKEALFSDWKDLNTLKKTTYSFPFMQFEWLRVTSIYIMILYIVLVFILYSFGAASNITPPKLFWLVPILFILSYVSLQSIDLRKTESNWQLTYFFKNKPITIEVDAYRYHWSYKLIKSRTYDIAPSGKQANANQYVINLEFRCSDGKNVVLYKPLSHFSSQPKMPYFYERDHIKFHPYAETIPLRVVRKINQFG